MFAHSHVRSRPCVPNHSKEQDHHDSRQEKRQVDQPSKSLFFPLLEIMGGENEWGRKGLPYLRQSGKNHWLKASSVSFCDAPVPVISTSWLRRSSTVPLLSRRSLCGHHVTSSSHTSIILSFCSPACSRPHCSRENHLQTTVRPSLLGCIDSSQGGKQEQPRRKEVARVSPDGRALRYK